MKQSVFDYSYEMRMDRNHKILRNVLVILSMLVFVFLVNKFLIFSVFQKSESMEYAVDKNSAVFITPLPVVLERGDVVYVGRLDRKKFSGFQNFIGGVVRIFTAQQIDPFESSHYMSEKPTLRRIIAVPGDTIYMRDYVAYIKPAGSRSYLTEFELSKKNYDLIMNSVPEGWNDVGLNGSISERVLGPEEYFVLSDNRMEAADSRLWGNLSAEDIKGKAVLRYFPFSKFKVL